MNELQKLPNVGQVLADHLVRIGINTPEQLRTKTAEEVFLTIRHQCDAGACLHMLYGIEGAIQGIPKAHLTYQRKQALRLFFNQLS
ncbi:TfoX/Sxy family DNA transformation protein [Enterococcus casseliflavus]|uniref:TfoX/Sxy family DNA transformation protein n=1 Tax=Enterococcus casseliflavus TaxID=37734 RepID=UPI000EADDFC8|nr:TfoX/Sxy family DNA transformation protein [Enterococcus casseliflavus]AYJ45822.1 competence protein TfoX [Enterococcus casseliflavus]MBS5814732.1 TfoX/Sxy family DNA transformation protein [Enterococcus casseliflavus]MCD4963360.1 TfoX/Sxy family DNA transformation protein [Enterococcus casseliflavus]MDU3374501.1 TfoX/Sxy family DNA transformation protein [Enterococcus casseliflavus]HJE16513.1 TfoX/Sxy family protein [Enterococcus casseliflavus]